VSRPSTEAQRFEALYRAHYAAIVRFVHRRIDPASAEEIVADTFAIAWRRLDDVPADPLPWLYVVARNLLHGEHRSAASARDKAAGVALVSSLDRGRDPADALAERDHVLRAFAALSEPDREALRLVAWEGLDHRDAARVAGTSRVAFTMRVSRARRRLAAALAELDQPHPTLSTTTPIPESQT
jgi:RNA polymerase sigma-70 factor (ECF subfamily)